MLETAVVPHVRREDVPAKSGSSGPGSEPAARTPLAPEDADTATPAAISSERRPARQALRRRRILVVDDNRDSAESVRTLLVGMGHEVRTAFDGEEALGIVPSFRPQVVLLDLGMPKLNGYEVARRIRELPGGRDISLIALTGWGLREDRAQSRAAGIDHHLVKPVDLAVLRELVHRGPAGSPPPLGRL